MSNPPDQPKTDLYGQEVGKRPSEEAYTKEQWEDAGPSGERLSRYETKYGVARGMASLFALIGWLAIAAGIAVGFLSGGNGLAGYLMAGGIVMYGLFVVMAAQIVMATLDNADHTGEMLALMKSRK